MCKLPASCAVRVLRGRRVGPGNVSFLLKYRETVMLLKQTSAKRSPCVIIAVVAALATASCGQTEPTPTAPSTVTVPTRGVLVRPASSPSPAQASPSPAPAPTPAPVPAPGTALGKIQITISPSPVPFSGQPITDIASCQNRPNTWFYDQVLKEVGGVAVTVTQRVDSFDGASSAPTNPGLRIAATGSTTIRTRWCSVSASAHTAQSPPAGRTQTERPGASQAPWCACWRNRASRLWRRRRTSLTDSPADARPFTCKPTFALTVQAKVVRHSIAKRCGGGAPDYLRKPN